MATESTTVELTVVSKKQGFRYSKQNPTAHEIELEVPYDQKNIFWKLSGGTNMVLNTINQDAADMFVIGETVVMTIAPKQIAKPDTGDPHDCPKGYVWSDEQQMCIADVG